MKKHITIIGVWLLSVASCTSPAQEGTSARLRRQETKLCDCHAEMSYRIYDGSRTNMVELPFDVSESSRRVEERLLAGGYLNGYTKADYLRLIDTLTSSSAGTGLPVAGLWEAVEPLQELLFSAGNMAIFFRCYDQFVQRESKATTPLEMQAYYVMLVPERGDLADPEGLTGVVTSVSDADFAHPMYRQPVVVMISAIVDQLQHPRPTAAEKAAQNEQIRRRHDLKAGQENVITFFTDEQVDSISRALSEADR